MYVNKCIKCGREFETKNPKRVICPDCLYPDKSMMINPTNGEQTAVPKENQQLQSYSTPEAPRYYSAGGDPDEQQRYSRPQRSNYNRDGYSQGSRNSGYNRGSYGRDNRRSSYGQRSQGGYSRDNRGGYPQRRPNNRFNNRRPAPKPRGPKQLLITKEQLEQIELLYKPLLPLPNPDSHEVIAEKIGLEPRKVFFGINLIRQKMLLPKLPFPKRKLAISPDQLFAIKSLYEPLLPLPPIGCHKIIAAQLKMDEWRVHVGIGLVRAQMGLKRWNQDRPDAPEEYRKPKKTVNVVGEVSPEGSVDKEKSTDAPTTKKSRKSKKTEETAE